MQPKQHWMSFLQTDAIPDVDDDADEATSSLISEARESDPSLSGSVEQGTLECIIEPNIGGSERSEHWKIWKNLEQAHCKLNGEVGLCDCTIWDEFPLCDQSCAEEFTILNPLKAIGASYIALGATGKKAFQKAIKAKLPEFTCFKNPVSIQTVILANNAAAEWKLIPNSINSGRYLEIFDPGSGSAPESPKYLHCMQSTLREKGNIGTHEREKSVVWIYHRAFGEIGELKPENEVWCGVVKTKKAEARETDATTVQSAPTRYFSLVQSRTVPLLIRGIQEAKQRSHRHRSVAARSKNSRI